jgi:hypothetical protein
MEEGRQLWKFFKKRTKEDMNKDNSREKRHILPEMTVLDVVSRYRGSEAIFKKYDEQAGECICCNTLFETLRDVAEKYGIDLERLLKELDAFTEFG